MACKRPFCSSRVVLKSFKLCNQHHTQESTELPKCSDKITKGQANVINCLRNRSDQSFKSILENYVSPILITKLSYKLLVLKIKIIKFTSLCNTSLFLEALVVLFTKCPYRLFAKIIYITADKLCGANLIKLLIASFEL